MRLKVLVFLVAATCCAARLAGQDSIGGPVLGLDYDSTGRSIRPLLGIAGAATTGAPLVPNLVVTRAFVAPGGSFALAEVDSGESLVLLEASSRGPVILGARAGAKLVAFSASGKSAVLYYAEPRMMVVLRGLPGSPTVSEVDYGSLPGELRSLAVRDDGSTILVGVVEDGGGSVYSALLSGEFHYRFPLVEPSSIAFTNADKDAIVADRGANRIVLARNIDEDVLLSDQAAGESGVDSPGLVAASRDGKTVFVAGGGGSIQAIAVNDGSSQRLQCNCEPLGMTRLAGNAVFRLVTPAGTPILLLDGDALPLRIVFVPPPAVVNSPIAEGVVEEPVP